MLAMVDAGEKCFRLSLAEVRGGYASCSLSHPLVHKPKTARARGSD